MPSRADSIRFPRGFDFFKFPLTKLWKTCFNVRIRVKH